MKISLQSTMLSKISSSISRRSRCSGDAQQVKDDELDRSIHATTSKSSSRTRHTTKKSHSDMFHRLHLLNRLPNTTDIKCDSSHDSSSTSSASSSKLSTDSSKKSSKRSRMFRRDSCSSTCSTSTTNTTIIHQPYNVSFLEELVTDIQYRPRTTSSEKKQLYYNKTDYAIFQQYLYFENEELDLYGILEDEIISIKRIRDETKYELDIWKDKMMDKKKVVSLICREQRQVVNAWLM